ncbi:hypothetical protein CUS80_00435 [Enterococcus faecium]|nr:hypothetical protein CUS80_00435 [Enterococcus faecium]
MILIRKGKWKELVVTGFFFFFVLFLCFVLSCYSVEQSRRYIPTFESKGKVLFFYREDCRDCQLVFPYVYARNLFCKDTVFVNLNEPLNRKVYLSVYDISFVPTLVNGDVSYSGTNFENVFSVYAK